ncbi:MAG: carboxypeptidase-like regulatory domain-containing protein [Candidatus Aminicenantes bacterium]|jgi:hypothetical protein
MQIEDKGIYKKRSYLSLWVLFLFFMVPMSSTAETPVIKKTISYKPGCGHLRGFIYKSDGETPLWGAQVVLQHMQTRQVFRGNVTDSTGDYELLNIPAGSYVVLILTRNKVYNVKRVDFLIKIIANKTSTISFSLKKSPSGLLLFLLEPCCEAAVVSGTALAIALVKKFSGLKKETEQSPTQR